MKTGLMCTIWHAEKSVLLDFECGFGCTIHAMVWIGNGVRMGSNCSIQPFAFLPEGVILHDNVFIGPHVCFTNDKYPPTYIGHGMHPKRPETVVEDFVSIGANATILPGVRIGHGAMIGAGAIVTKNVPPHALVIGSKIVQRERSFAMENDTGFVQSGYINKKGTKGGDNFNVMPPGYEIDNQPNADVSEMTMKKITPLGYPGSGARE